MNKTVIALFCALLFLGNGCFYSKMTVGQGPHKGIEERHTQWYVLWGVVPLGGTSDGILLDEENEDSRVYIGYSGWDALFNIFLMPVTSVGRNTVIIEK